jgi:hemerythrin-like metal-binding protein
MYPFQDPGIDSDHDFIISRFEGMRGLAASKGYDQLGRKTFIDMFIYYTSSHFGREDEIMRRSGYPGYAEHLMAHAYLQREFSSLRRTMPEGNPNLSSDLAAFRQMFILHILTHDEAYGEWLHQQNQRQDGPPPAPLDRRKAGAPRHLHTSPP